MKPEQIAKAGTEHAHQAALICWASTHPVWKQQLRWMFAIPNGGDRNRAVASRLKAEGVKSGVVDVFLPVPVRWSKLDNVHDDCFYHGLWIEMKKPDQKNKKNGGMSDNQVEFMGAMDACGYKCVLCHSWLEASAEIEKYLELGLRSGD